MHEVDTEQLGESSQDAPCSQDAPPAFSRKPLSIYKFLLFHLIEGLNLGRIQSLPTHFHQ